MWRDVFDEKTQLQENSSRVGLMKLRVVEGEQKYAVALQDDSGLWLTMWVRCTRKGEIFIMYPRGDRDWDAHASYHLDGTLHQKSHGAKTQTLKRQPLGASFKGSEHLGSYAGHGKSSGAVCDPKAFDEVVAIGPEILGPIHGFIAFDLVQAGYEPKPNPGVIRRVCTRGARPSLIITVCQADQGAVFLRWPEDFDKAERIMV